MGISKTQPCAPLPVTYPLAFSLELSLSYFDPSLSTGCLTARCLETTQPTRSPQSTCACLLFTPFIFNIVNPSRRNNSWSVPFIHSGVLVSAVSPSIKTNATTTAPDSTPPGNRSYTTPLPGKTCSSIRPPTHSSSTPHLGVRLCLCACA